MHAGLTNLHEVGSDFKVTAFLTYEYYYDTRALNFLYIYIWSLVLMVFLITLIRAKIINYLFSVKYGFYGFFKLINFGETRHETESITLIINVPSLLFSTLLP